MYDKAVLVTCIVPARNEAGRLRKTIDDAISTRLVDEVIIVEGGSSDETWKVAQEIAEEESGVTAIQQEGKGKFDAVRCGFTLSQGRFIVIWDADGTVRPEDCIRLISCAVTEQRTVVGNRLTGRRHKGSMRTANLLGNFAFSIIWSPWLNFKIVDLLCGSKVFLREDFVAVPRWVLKRDPFGDFTLIASAIANFRKPISIPVEYFPREYGKTNIKRWRSGLFLLHCSLYCFTWIFLSRLIRKK